MTPMQQLNVASPVDLEAWVGKILGISDWVVIEQSRIDAFAKLTEDEQWIHVDRERSAEGPFGAPIAHGFLTLSLCTKFIQEALEVQHAGVTINYGLNRVRFPSPVPAGTRLRGTTELASWERLDGAVQIVANVTVEAWNVTKPACVCEMVIRYIDPR